MIIETYPQSITPFLAKLKKYLTDADFKNDRIKILLKAEMGKFQIALFLKKSDTLLSCLIDEDTEVYLDGMCEVSFKSFYDVIQSFMRLEEETISIELVEDKINIDDGLYPTESIEATTVSSIQNGFYQPLLIETDTMTPVFETTHIDVFEHTVPIYKTTDLKVPLFNTNMCYLFSKKDIQKIDLNIFAIHSYYHCGIKDKVYEEMQLAIPKHTIDLWSKLFKKQEVENPILFSLEKLDNQELIRFDIDNVQVDSLLSKETIVGEDLKETFEAIQENMKVLQTGIPIMENISVKELGKIMKDDEVSFLNDHWIRVNENGYPLLLLKKIISKLENNPIYFEWTSPDKLNLLLILMDDSLEEYVVLSKNLLLS